MNFNKLLLAATVAAALTNCALAANKAPAKAQDSGVFVGANIGYGGSATPGANIPENTTDAGFTYGAQAGYQLNKNVAFGAGYDRLGSIKDDGGPISYSAKYQAVNVFAKGSYYFTKPFSVFAKAGYARIFEDVSLAGKSTTSSGNGFLFGLGASYQVMKKLSVVGGLDLFAANHFNSQKFTLGVSYLFPIG